MTKTRAWCSTALAFGLFTVAIPSQAASRGPHVVPTVNETEPNDAKAQANAIPLPPANQPAVITGNSTSGTGTGLDYFLLTTAPQGAPGFYRHRIIIQSATPGHTGTIRGLSQAGGVIDPASDIDFQISDPATTPPRFVQWYTSQASADIFVRIEGTPATTANYTLDYEVAPVTEIMGPTSATQSLVITTVGQTTADTELWVYDSNRAALDDDGNDDEPNGPTLQSLLDRTRMPGQYHLAISDFNLGNDQEAAPDDDFQDGNVLDFPGNTANDTLLTNQDMDMLIGPTLVPAIKVGPFDVLFVDFTVVVPVELLDFEVE